MRFHKIRTRCNRNLLPTVIGLLLCACTSGRLTSPERPAFPLSGNQSSRTLIDLTSPEGEQLLFGSRTRADYLPLSIHFETQQNLAYCGVASMAMVLNAMAIPAPVAPEYARYPMFTQNNLLDDKTEKIVGIDAIKRQGLTLAQLGQLLAAKGLQTQVIFGGDSDLDEFRKLAINNLKQPGNFILVNYLRKAIGQETGGHISPLAAYHEGTDRFLILDVSRFKYPPVWVTTEHLWRAMNTIDGTSGRTRGFVLVNLPAKP